MPQRDTAPAPEDIDSQPIAPSGSGWLHRMLHSVLTHLNGGHHPRTIWQDTWTVLLYLFFGFIAVGVVASIIRIQIAADISQRMLFAGIILATALMLWSLIRSWIRHNRLPGLSRALYMGGVLLLAGVPFALSLNVFWPFMWQSRTSVSTDFRVTSKEGTLYFLGDINEASAAAFLQEAQAYGSSISTVQLTSGGGLIGPARTIADEIRARGWNTQVESKCASACLMVFAAGTERHAGYHSAFGCHSGRSHSLIQKDFSSGIDVLMELEPIAAQRARLASAWESGWSGFPDLGREPYAHELENKPEDITEAVGRISNRCEDTPSNSMHYMNYEDLVKAGFVTHVQSEYTGTEYFPAVDADTGRFNMVEDAGLTEKFDIDLYQDWYLYHLLGRDPQFGRIVSANTIGKLFESEPPGALCPLDDYAFNFHVWLDPEGELSPSERDWAERERIREESREYHTWARTECPVLLDEDELARPDSAYKTHDELVAEYPRQATDCEARRQEKAKSGLRKIGTVRSYCPQGIDTF